MNIWTTPERQQLRKTVRAFAEREILPHVDEWERIGELPRGLHPSPVHGIPPHWGWATQGVEPGNICSFANTS